VCVCVCVCVQVSRGSGGAAGRWPAWRPPRMHAAGAAHATAPHGPAPPPAAHMCVCVCVCVRVRARRARHRTVRLAAMSCRSCTMASTHLTISPGAMTALFSCTHTRTHRARRRGRGARTGQDSARAVAHKRARVRRLRACSHARQPAWSCYGPPWPRTHVCLHMHVHNNTHTHACAHAGAHAQSRPRHPAAAHLVEEEERLVRLCLCVGHAPEEGREVLAQHVRARRVACRGVVQHVGARAVALSRGVESGGQEAALVVALDWLGGRVATTRGAHMHVPSRPANASEGTAAKRNKQQTCAPPRTPDVLEEGLAQLACRRQLPLARLGRRVLVPERRWRACVVRVLCVLCVCCACVVCVCVCVCLTGQAVWLRRVHVFWGGGGVCARPMRPAPTTAS
jgi:hypothetical protein